MKTFEVFVYYYPAEGVHSHCSKELWLGYTGWGRNGSSKDLFGRYTVQAETRSRAITKAINFAKKDSGGRLAKEGEK